MNESKPEFEQIQMKCPNFTELEKRLLYDAMDFKFEKWMDTDILFKMSMKEIQDVMNEYFEYQEEIGKHNI